MASDELPFGYTHRQKRSHAQMELEGSSSPTWSNFTGLSSRERSASASHPQLSGLHLPRLNSMPSGPPRRYPGDGFDFRRPVTSANVIDLTHDDAGPSGPPSDRQRTSGRAPRPPRFGRDIIIDVEQEDARRAAAPSGSPEIEFISSRPIDPPRRQDPPTFSRNNSDEDEVEFVGENTLPESQRRRPANFDFMLGLLDDPELGEVNHLRARIERRANAERQRQATVDRVMQRIRRAGPIPPPRNRRGHIHQGFLGFLPPDLNFNVVGFNLGFNHENENDGPAPSPPTYDAPEKAPQGFTRSPEEKDVLVCPNCEDELCVGESELKKQVWIVKNCGHVYCGECTANRSLKKSAKGKEKQPSLRTKPFKECVVEGCQKRVSNRAAMTQIFL